MDVWVVAEVDDGCVVGRLDAVGVAREVVPTNVVGRNTRRLDVEVLRAETIEATEATELVAITVNTEPVSEHMRQNTEY